MGQSMAYFLPCGDCLLYSAVFGSGSETQGSDEPLKEQEGWDWGFLEAL